MKIILFSRTGVHYDKSELQEIFDAIEAFGFDYMVNEEFIPSIETSIGRNISFEKRYGECVGEQPAKSVMLCIGGDGTLLEGVHRLRGASIPVIGINLGHLGFLTSVSKKSIVEVFKNIAAGDIYVDQRSMLEVRGEFLEAPESSLALNEFSIQRQGAGMVSVEVFVDGQMVGTYHGDGVLVCTPTGSTAYSLSAGGPIVAPQCSCLVISPLAPHNLTMRPMVVPDSSEITLRSFTRYSEPFATLDNRTYKIRQTAEFHIKRAVCNVLLGVQHNISFYDTLRDKMMWGVDVRS